MKQQKNIIMKFRAIFLLSFVSIILLSTLKINIGSASAASPPYTPGCYSEERANSNDRTAKSCPDNIGLDATKCYEIKRVRRSNDVRYVVIDCGTAAPTNSGDDVYDSGNDAKISCETGVRGLGVGTWTPDSGAPNGGRCVCPSDSTLTEDKYCVATAEAVENLPDSSTEGLKPVETDCEPGINPSTGKVEQLSSGNCGIVKYLVTGINFLSAIAGMAIIFSIMFAGFQYMTAQDNPQAISAAKYRIIWAIVALMMLLFTYAGLNFLVPGGVL